MGLFYESTSLNKNEISAIISLMQNLQKIDGESNTSIDGGWISVPEGRGGGKSRTPSSQQCSFSPKISRSRLSPAPAPAPHLRPDTAGAATTISVAQHHGTGARTGAVAATTAGAAITTASQTTANTVRLPITLVGTAPLSRKRR